MKSLVARASLGARSAIRRDVVHSTFWGLADQTMVSAANFVTMLLLARALGPRGFGGFVLAYTILLFGNGMQLALITYPHNVLGGAYEGNRYVAYTSGLARVQVLVVTVGLVLGAAAAVVAGLLVGGATFVLGIAAAFASWQLQEFCRRVLYTEGRLRSVFTNDLVSYVGQACVIAALWRTDRLTAVTALFSLAATSACAAALGAGQLRHSLGLKRYQRGFRENWLFGKWLAAGTIALWLSNVAYLYLAAALIGAGAAGAIGAALLLLGPINVLLFSLNNVLSVRFGRIVARAEVRALHRELRLAYLISSPIVVGYCVGVAIFAAPLLKLAYGARYRGFSAVLVLLAVFMILTYTGWIASIALSALRETKAVFLATSCGAFVALTGGWVAIAFAGVSGAAWGMVASALCTSLVVWWMYLRARARAEALLAIRLESQLA